MQVVKKVLNLPKNAYLETHLSIVNAVLPDERKLTPKEIVVLARFMAFEGDLAKDRFGPTARKLIKLQLNLSDGGLGNYMRAFITKNLLSITTLDDNNRKVYSIKPFIIPDPQSQEYNFTIINNEQAKS